MCVHNKQNLSVVSELEAEYQWLYNPCDRKRWENCPVEPHPGLVLFITVVIFRHRDYKVCFSDMIYVFFTESEFSYLCKPSRSCDEIMADIYSEIRKVMCIVCRFQSWPGCSEGEPYFLLASWVPQSLTILIPLKWTNTHPKTQPRDSTSGIW